ncbi:37S ribosomal protein S5 [Cordyceps fumosorosea ARSEF 2679]|uniref:Small ribosomal subunit protein uS5m n=1 Tax=Cordyceps fumosorosea (strain ARSEF 2679) TaxID=1081104 RepID=A0A167MY83_CORFA|nr:37S ribosomal protein S5 [Cordyceps fumosorosea ARSEF 2679]OAA54896.1 37S ribosomal protein S5 [Cordyceps fumosorosea ARSEF 2679]
MSVVRPARSALSRCVAAAPSNAAPVAAATPCRQFHSSVARTKRQPRFRNVKAEELGLVRKGTVSVTADMARFKQEHLPEYTEEQLERLRGQYTPEQVEAIRAGEAAVDAEDVLVQGRIRDDPYRPTYVEDYATLDPRFDIMPSQEGEARPPREHKWLGEQDWMDQFSARLSELVDRKTDAQLTRAMARALRRVKDAQGGTDVIDMTEEELAELEKNPEMLQKYLVKEGEEGAAAGTGAELTEAQVQKLDEAVEAEWKKELEALASADDRAAAVEVSPTSLEMLEGGPAEASVRGPAESAEAPELGRIPGVAGRYNRAADPEDGGQDDLGEYQEIKRVTGLALAEIKALYCKVLVLRWVSNQTRMGKIRSTSVVAIAGNGAGRLGIGMAKSTDQNTSVVTAQMLAIRNMKAIRRYENRTIYGNSTAKVGATVVELFNRPPGFGLRVPHRLFEMCRAVGLHDIAARMPRAKNPMNSVFATYKALMNQPDPEEIARGRGKKLADARKVYYGGSVH